MVGMALYSSESSYCAVVKGKVVKTQEFKNLTLRNPNDEREAERAQHHLWPFPRQEAGTIQVHGVTADWKRCITTVPPARLERTPPWPNLAANPPLSRSKAELLANRKAKEFVRGTLPHKWEVEKAILKAAGNDRYYYEFEYRASPPIEIPDHPTPRLTLIVLMDGTVAEPVAWDWYAYQREPGRRLRSGRMENGRRQAALAEARPRRSVVRTSLAPGLQLFGRIAAAPKLLYEIEKLEAYSNGAWVEYSVTNLDKKPHFLAPAHLHTPIWNAGFWDAKGEKWYVPRLDDKVEYHETDQFIRIDAGQKLRYRLLLSFLGDAPLEPLNWLHEQPPHRPAAVEYFLAAWPNARASSAKNAKEAQVFAFGYGRVPVMWSDKQYPKSRRGKSRCTIEGRSRPISIDFGDS